MARIAIVCVSAFLLLQATSAQRSRCEVRSPFRQNDFVSAFRRAYLDQFGGNNGHNLAAEANRLYQRTDFVQVPNFGDCMQMFENDKDSCESCAGMIGWRADRSWVGTRANHRRFANALRENMCTMRANCVSPSPSPSPFPQARVFTVRSVEDGSLPVWFGLGLVAELGSTRLFYDIADVSGVTVHPGFDGAILDYTLDGVDHGFFDCAQAVLSEPGLGNRAAQQISTGCYSVQGDRFNNFCAQQAISTEICSSLRNRGCFPTGRVLVSQCP